MKTLILTLVLLVDMPTVDMPLCCFWGSPITRQPRAEAFIRPIYQHMTTQHCAMCAYRYKVAVFTYRPIGLYIGMCGKQSLLSSLSFMPRPVHHAPSRHG